MSEQSNPTFDQPGDSFEMVRVQPGTIEFFEREPHDTIEMYRQLFDTNPELALFLRREAEKLAPNLDERQDQSRLALEIVTLLSKQKAIDGLSALWEIEAVSGTGPLPPTA